MYFMIKYILLFLIFKDMEGSNNIQVVIYKNKAGEVATEAVIRDESVWLTLNQIASLFNTDKSGISRHLKNVFLTGELDKNSTVAKIATVQNEGERSIKREVEFYNLDAIISVGYRVNSKKATEFRVWAISVLRGHILDGYTLNQRRLLEIKGKQLNDFEQAVALVKRTIENRQLSAGESDGVLKVITDYANSWVLLQKYDQGKLSLPLKTKKPKFVLAYEEVKDLVQELKNNLISKKDASDLFGRERGEMLASIIGNIYQSFGGKEFYSSVEEKAAHLLYFIIKDHPFSDGNKRTASFLFIVFLARNKYLLKKDGEKKINDNTLVALALLIAESDPKQKDVLIKLVVNFLVE